MDNIYVVINIPWYKVILVTTDFGKIVKYALNKSYQVECWSNEELSWMHNELVCAPDDVLKAFEQHYKEDKEDK